MHRSIVISLLALVVLGGGVGGAAADDLASYEVEGDADTSSADPRVAALDEAFARAVTLAIDELVAPAVRAARKADLDREVVGRARLWVARFTVKRDQTASERRQLAVTVRIDRDRLRLKLDELKVEQMSAGEASQGRAVTVLLRVNEPTGIRASFGGAAEKQLPGFGALSSALRQRGMTVRRAPATGPEVRAAGEVPVTDEDAAALAAEAKADLAAIAGVTVGAPVAIRGQDGGAALVTAYVRLVERRGGTLMGRGTATVAARGVGPSVVEQAVDRALVAAAGDVLPAAGRVLSAASGFSGDDTPTREAGVVLVRLAPRTPWGIVVAEQKYLAGARGVQRAVLRRLSPGGWVIGVTTTESVQRIAQIAKRPPATDTAVRVKVNGDIVEVSLSGSP